MANLRDVARMRAVNQHLVNGASSPADVVRSMLAIQAQDFDGAMWAIGVRSLNSTLSNVTDALDSGEIVRSWPIRGTLHLMAADDLPWLLKLTGQRTLNANKSRYSQLGIDDETRRKVRRIAETVLASNPMKRAELHAAFEHGGIAASGERGLHLLGSLALDGVICFGPMAGKAQLVVLSDEWIKSPREIDREESLHELAVRYFASHGPATERDLATWSKLPLTDLRRAIASADDMLISLSVDGQLYWTVNDSVAKATGVQGLPTFDEMLIGYQDRSAILDAEHAKFVTAGGMFYRTILSDGHVIGTWKRTVKKQTMLVECTLFRDITKREETQLHESLSAFARFYEKELELV